MERIYEKELDSINILLHEYYKKNYTNEEDSHCENLKIKDNIKNNKNS